MSDVSTTSASLRDHTVDSSTGSSMATQASYVDILSPTNSTISLPPISPPSPTSPPEEGLRTPTPPSVSDYGISPSPPPASSPIPPPPPAGPFEGLPPLASESSSSAPPPSRSSSGGDEVVLRFAENYGTPSPTAAISRYVDEIAIIGDQVENRDRLERTPPGVTVVHEDYLDREEILIRITFGQNIYKCKSKWGLEDIMSSSQLATLERNRIQVSHLSSIFAPSWDRRLLKSSFISTYKPAVEACLATASSLVIWLENTESMSWRKMKRQADEAEGYVWLSLPRVTPSGLRHLRPLRCVAEVGVLHEENGMKSKCWLTQAHPRTLKYSLAKTTQRRNMLAALSEQQTGWLYCHGLRSANLRMLDGTLAQALFVDHELVNKFLGNISSLLNYSRSETEPEEYRRLLTTKPSLRAMGDEDIELIGEVRGYDGRCGSSLQEDQDDVQFNNHEDEDLVL